MIKIDRLDFNDLHGLKLLYENAFEGSKTDYEKMISNFNQIKDNPNYVILCAKSDKQIVGSVLGVICTELFGQCNPFMVLEDVAVLSTHRRLEIAKRLMLEIEEHAKAAKCSMIIFVSSQHRTGAHKLYESVGYGIDKVNGYRKRLN
jgi:ribosomal protein S18 acetylase RimI-like enzyme